MPDEKQLADHFNRTLSELREAIKTLEVNSLDYDPVEQYNQVNARGAFPYHMSEIRRKIQALRTIGVSEQKINDTIIKILERVRNEIVRVLQNASLVETQKHIFQHLDNIDGSLNFSYDERKNQASTRQMWAHELGQLEQLSIAEADLVKAQARVLEVLDKLMKAAEKLD